MNSPLSSFWICLVCLFLLGHAQTDSSKKTSYQFGKELEELTPPKLSTKNVDFALERGQNDAALPGFSFTNLDSPVTDPFTTIELDSLLEMKPEQIESIIDSLSQASDTPTEVPSFHPSFDPTEVPSESPSFSPSATPSNQPSYYPTFVPTAAPTDSPSFVPTESPSAAPTRVPSVTPSTVPTAVPTTATPTAAPSTVPTKVPSITMYPSEIPTPLPSATPTFAPSARPSTAAPTFPLDPPKILSIAVDETATTANRKTQIPIVVTTEYVGSNVFCGVFSADTVSPSSVDAIRTQNVKGFAGTTSVMMTFSGLIPVTQYKIFCTSVTLDGSRVLSLADSASVSLSTTTDCCKIVTATITTTSAIVRTNVQNAISARFDYAPSRDIMIVFSTDNTAGASYFPSSYNLTSQSSASSVSSLLVSRVGGQYSIGISLAGSSKDEYQVNVVGQNQLRVLEANEEPPTPQLTSAVFSSDGSFVTVSFDASTNRAEYSSSFPCSLLFSFRAISTASCVWQDASTAIIFPAPNVAEERLVPGLSLSLKSVPTFKARCTWTSGCASWRSISASSVTVAAPLVLSYPVVRILSPAFITACQSLVLDLTSSTGSAGRDWASVSVSAQAVGSSPPDNLGALNDFLRTNYSLTTYSSPATIPRSLLSPGSTYVFSATMCNFLTACTTTTRTIQQSMRAIAPPIVSIIGSTSFTVSRRQSVQIQATAYTESCDGTVSFSGISYGWTVADVQTPSTVILSATTTLPNYRIPSFTLPANRVYVVTLTATNGDGSTTATAQVTVTQGRLFAVVSGGGNRVVQTGVVSEIDGSQSYDEDVFRLTGSEAGLVYEWTCIQTAPDFTTNCDNTLTLTSAFSSKLSIQPVSDLAADTVSLITLNVYDQSRSRSSSATVSVSITTEAINGLAITTSAQSLVSVPTTRRFSLSARLDVITPCTAAWAVDDKTVNLTSATLTPYVRSFGKGLSQPFNLGLVAGVLPERATLTFSLQCGLAVTAVVATTNGAPLPGSFNIDPKEGIEMGTLFNFVAAGWNDPDLPLTYQFGFYSFEVLASLSLQSRSPLSYMSTKMASGYSLGGYKVDCTLLVFDVYDAVTQAGENIVVRQLTLEEQNAKVESLLSASSLEGASIDAQKSVLAVASTVMNAANCSLAPSCAALNRKICLRTDHTCGECNDGYIGDAGDRNTACRSTDEMRAFLSVDVSLERRKLQVQTCVANADCGNPLKVCSSGICKYSSKGCAADCSGRGTCGYYESSTGQAVSSCSVIDSGCVAECECDSGYQGKGCEYSESELDTAISLRTSLINALDNVIRSDDVSSETVEAWSNYISSITSSPYEISTESAKKIRDITEYAITKAQELGLDYSNILGLLNTLDVLQTNLKWDLENGNFTRRRLSEANAAGSVIDLVTAFTDIISSTKVAGESTTQYLYDNFRITVDVAVPDVDGFINATTPQTTLESLLKEQENRVSIRPNVPVGATNLEITTTYIETTQDGYTDDLLSFYSNPVRLKLSSPSMNASEFADSFVTELILRLVHNANVEMFVFGNDSMVNVTTVCQPGDTSTHINYCPISNKVVYHSCKNGGTFVTVCPKIEPACNRLDVSTSEIQQLGQCSVVEFTSAATVCSCQVASKSSRRSLIMYQNESVPVLGLDGTTDLISAWTLTTNMKTTFFPPNDDDAKGSYYIILMFSLLWAFVLILVFGGYLIQKATYRSVVPDQAASGLAEQMSQQISVYLDVVLPSIYRRNVGFWSRPWEELRANHPFAVMLFPVVKKPNLTERLSKGLRVLSVLTMVMFIQALFFNDQNPGDDDECKTNYTRSSCLDKKSPLDSSVSYCEWDGSSCSYNNSVFSMAAVVYVMIFVNLCSMVFKPLLDYFITMLRAPLVGDDVDISIEMMTQDGAYELKRKIPGELKSQLAVHQRFVDLKNVNGLSVVVTDPEAEAAHVSSIATQDLVPRESNTASQEALGLSYTEADPFSKQLLAYRASLDNDSLAYFDAQWNIDSVDTVTPKLSQNLVKKVGDINDYNNRDVDGISPAFERAPTAFAGFEIMYYFFVDVLGQRTDSATIFKNKINSDYRSIPAITLFLKVLGWTAILGINIFFITFTLVMYNDRTEPWQRRYLGTVLVQFAFEIFVFETIEVLWKHVFVPESVRSDVLKVANALDTISSNAEYFVEKLVEAANRKEGSAEGFNAANHLFLSTKLAKLKPTLLESRIVLSYENHYPGMLQRSFSPKDVPVMRESEIVSEEEDLARIRAHKEFTSTELFAFFVCEQYGKVYRLVGSVPELLGDLYIRLFHTALIGGLSLFLVHRYKDDACLPLFIVGIILTAGFFLLHRWAMYVVESAVSNRRYKAYLTGSRPSLSDQKGNEEKPLEVDLNDIETTASIGMKLDPEEKEVKKFNHSMHSPVSNVNNAGTVTKFANTLEL